jgi:hypothetical protein
MQDYGFLMSWMQLTTMNIGEKYSGASMERCHFVAVCGFFELSGVLVNHELIDQNLYFDIFNPTPFWNKAKPIVEGMRSKRPHIYESFESLNSERLSWKEKRNTKRKMTPIRR